MKQSFYKQSDYEELANVILQELYIPIDKENISVFLCGGDFKSPNNNRTQLIDKVEEYIEKHTEIGYKSYRRKPVRFLYPEDIFDDLLYNAKSTNLLELENLLAYSVDAIVIFPESAGSYAELGAFTNNEQLRQKIICFQDQKYKRKRSFINQGPIKLIKSSNENSVLYFDPLNIENSIKPFLSALNQIKSSLETRHHADKLNLLQIESFLIPTIYLLEPIQEEDLSSIVKYVLEDKNQRHTQQITSSALSSSIKRKDVELSQEGYCVSKNAKDSLLSPRWISGSTTKHVDLIDKLRLRILNLQYRKKKLSIPY